MDKKRKKKKKAFAEYVSNIMKLNGVFTEWKNYLPIDLTFSSLFLLQHYNT